jgi:hypothetical protein
VGGDVSPPSKVTPHTGGCLRVIPLAEGPGGGLSMEGGGTQYGEGGVPSMVRSVLVYGGRVDNVKK